MKALRAIGGGALALLALVALAAGLLTPQGTSALRALRDFGTALFGWLGDMVARLGGGRVAGNPGRALIVWGIVFVIAMFAVPAARASRGGVVAAALAATLVAVLFYQPSIVGG